jgi:hypothetical protein
MLYISKGILAQLLYALVAAYGTAECPAVASERTGQQPGLSVSTILPRVPNRKTSLVLHHVNSGWYYAQPDRTSPADLVK